MYFDDDNAGQQLGGGTLSKIRGFIHRLAPRELSPTLMLKKYASNTKKKGKAKIAAVQATTDAHKAEGEAILAQQIAKLTAATPSALSNDPLPDEIAADFPVTPASPPKSVIPKWAPYALLGGLAVLGAVTYRRRRR